MRLVRRSTACAPLCAKPFINYCPVSAREMPSQPADSCNFKRQQRACMGLYRFVYRHST